MLVCSGSFENSKETGSNLTGFESQCRCAVFVSICGSLQSTGEWMRMMAVRMATRMMAA